MEIERFKEIMDEVHISLNYQTKDDTLEGFNLIQGYTQGKVISSAEHDIIYSVMVEDIAPFISEEDTIRLAKLGFFVDSDFNRLATFV